MTIQTKTLGVLLKESFNLYSRNIGVLSKIALAVYLPLSLTSFFIFNNAGNFLEEPNLLNSFQVFFLLLVFYCAAIIFSLLYQVTIIKAIDFSARNMTFRIGDVFRESWNVLGSYAWVTFLVFIKVILWTILLIIPGIVFGVFYSCASFAAVLEDKRGSDALIYSKTLVVPSVWKFVGNIITVSLMMFPVYILISILVSLASGGSEAAQPHVFSLVGMILGNLMSVVAGIYPMVFFYLLYQELKKNI